MSNVSRADGGGQQNFGKAGRDRAPLRRQALTPDEWSDVLSADIVLNREQRRRYIREVQPSRLVRIYQVGFGLWRRAGHGRARENWAQPGDDASESRRAAKGSTMKYVCPVCGLSMTHRPDCPRRTR